MARGWRASPGVCAGIGLGRGIACSRCAGPLRARGLRGAGGPPLKEKLDERRSSGVERGPGDLFSRAGESRAGLLGSEQVRRRPGCRLVTERQSFCLVSRLRSGWQCLEQQGVRWRAGAGRAREARGGLAGGWRTLGGSGGGHGDGVRNRCVGAAGRAEWPGLSSRGSRNRALIWSG